MNRLIGEGGLYVKTIQYYCQNIKKNLALNNGFIPCFAAISFLQNKGIKSLTIPGLFSFLHNIQETQPL